MSQISATRLLQAAAVSSLLVSSTAWAHALLVQPPPRDNRDGWKEDRNPGFVQPCGVIRRASQPVTTFKPGASITIKFTETVNHPGCFLVDFAREGGTFQMLSVIPHKSSPGTPRPYEAMVTLPSMDCDSCILRLRQVMTEGLSAAQCPPANIPKAALYYSCANVVLSDAAAGDGGAPSGTDARAQDASAPSADGSGSQPSADVRAPTSGADAGSTVPGVGGSGGSSNTGGAGGQGGAGGTTTGGRRDASAVTTDDPPGRRSGGGCTFPAGSGGAAPVGTLVFLLALLPPFVRRKR